MFSLPIFGKKKFLLAIEYAAVLCEVAREQNVEITPELMEKAEAMMLGEFTTHSATNLAVNMIPNILSVFELDLNK